jgi:hypothetical protein
MHNIIMYNFAVKITEIQNVLTPFGLLEFNILIV